MSGGGIGGTLGSILGAALAPETGGLSIAIPAIAGAGGAALGGALTGSKNIGMDALMGGIGGGLGGYSGLGDSLGIGNSAGLFGDAASGAADAGASGLGSIGDNLGGDFLPSNFSNAMQIGSAAIPTDSIFSNGAQAVASGAASGAADTSSLLGRLGNYAVNNPLKTALAGNIGLSAIQSLLPHPKVNTGQNAADVMATNPNFNNPNLPKYNLQNSGTPYAGNWYTYGETPQTPMYNATLQPVPMAHGGIVKGYAAGGPAMPIPSQNPLTPSQQQAVSQPSGQAPVNPLLLKGLHTVGVAIGEHLKKHSPLFSGKVNGQGGGQDDAIPAKLSDGEYVVPADVTSHLGDGSSTAGGKALDHLVKNVREQKAVKGFPPKSKNPLAYIPKAKV